jgi:CRP/FNR family transcriptional regulator, nitrogen fixation regulation protein
MQADAVSGEPYAQTLKSLEGMAVNIRCSRGQEICHPSGSAEYCYRVVSGSARRCVIRSDGRRQILDLLLPGNFFGFSDPFEHDSSVEAIAKGTVIAAYPRKRIESLADKNPRLACEIRQVASKALARSRAYLLILGRITAREKVGAFLLNMAERTQGSANTIILPVSRYDIADCLGLSAETVCRSLTELRQRGKIALHNARCVTILDWQSLEEGDQGGALLARPKPRSRE